MQINGKDQTAIWVKNKTVYFIDQRKLPFTYEIYTAETVKDIVYAIKEMVVRGAPAIGAAAAYGMALGFKTPEKTATLLQSTRPTAHDLFYAIKYMLKHLKNGKNPFTVADLFVQDIIDRCRKIGDHGNTLIKDGMRILTHCNAGGLATVDYGTALAPFRAAHAQGKNIFVYADETRPRLQGLLTAWELQQEDIPHVLIVDNAAGYFIQLGQIDMVIVGADRIASNGDFANKIGTYEKAVLAKKHHIPFYVAAPISTFDKSIPTGKEIIIEERSPLEITHPFETQLMPNWVTVKNPAFDVTPRELVTGYITENGVIQKLD